MTRLSWRRAPLAGRHGFTPTILRNEIVPKILAPRPSFFHAAEGNVARSAGDRVGCRVCASARAEVGGAPPPRADRAPHALRAQTAGKAGRHKTPRGHHAHPSEREPVQAEGADPGAHADGGDQTGISGAANGLPHLPLGLLLASEVGQDDWTYI